MVFSSRHGRDCTHVSRTAVVALTWLLLLPLAIAQPAIAPDAKTEAKGVRKPAAFEPEKLKGSVESALAEIRARTQKGVAQTPAQVTSEERESARKARAMLVHVLTGQLETLEQMRQHETALRSAEKAEREWAGFADPPPYSNLLADDVREQVAIRRATVALLESSRSAIRAETERFSTQAEHAHEEVRRAAEALERAPGGTTMQAAANWRLEATRDRSILADALVATTNIASREVEMRLLISQSELRLSERQLAALEGKVRITQADVDGARSRLDAARAQWEKGQQVALAESAKWAQEREDAAAELASVRARRPARDSTSHERVLRLAEARFRAAEAWSNSLAQQVRILTVLATLYYERIAEAWHWRYAAMSGDDPDARRSASRKLNELVEYLRGWDSRSKTQQNEVRAAMQEQERRILSSTDPQVLKYEHEALAALRQLDLAFNSQQTVIERRLGRLSFWREDFGDALQARPMTEVIGDLYARARSLAREIWSYELLTIEDEVQVGGQTLTTTRGVTVGKSIGALLLFLIALQLMLFFSVRIERLMVRRFAVEEEKAKMMRRWINAFGVVIVLMIALNMARIPLAVFAFAGGALAIGIGFGMQTLIKNLISGVIVLLERRVRVGDVIEVEGVTGMVTAVDIRSSTVRGGDGIESMIPNALLLEKRVTNWTLTNRNLRRVIKIGVVHGSPVRTVAQILEACASRHGLVLKDPAPIAMFEDFSESALAFALYFWVTLGPKSDPAQIMSDLRFMIDKELREAGIVIALQRREIRIDTAHPMKLEVASAGASATPPGVHRILSSSGR